jgi:alginate O-acetyltransferase complex protein AlgI
MLIGDFFPTAVAIVFVLVLIGWVFFRAQTLGQAISILSIMFSLRNLSPAFVTSTIAATTLAVLVFALLRQAYFAADFKNFESVFAGRYFKPVTVGCLIAGCIFLRGPGSAFIYFQF